MKRTVSMILALLLFINISCPAYCYSPADKLSRGICNLFTFPFEIPNRIMQTNKRSGASEALTYGVFEGISMMCLRAAAGLYETITFFVPLPDGYKPVLNDPEYLFKKL